MSLDPLRREFNAHLAEEETASLDRLVHLGTIVEKSNGTELYRAGGEWDRKTKRYTGCFEKAHRIRLRPSQYEAAQYGLWWLQERKAGRPRDFVIEFLIGDRGGGKTALGSILAGLFVLEFPEFDGSPSIAWQVSKSHDERDEVDKDLKEFFPFEGRWYIYTEYRGHKYRWVNGATLKNISADDEEALKRGRVDFIFGNEVGKMGKRVPIYGIGRLKDKGGFGVFTSNRPTARSRWILQWAEKADEAKKAGKLYPVVFIKVPSAENDTLDRPTADQISQLVNDIDPSLADDDMEALFDPVGKRAYWKFQKPANVQEPPDLGDITREFTAKKPGVGRPFDFVGSVDFQTYPGVVATIWKVYGTLEAPVLWAVDEVEVPEATEEQYLEELVETEGGLYNPANLMWTGDNTGQIQNSKHDPRERTSFAVWAAHGWKIVPNVRPKDSSHRPNNPRVERRVGLTNYLLNHVSGRTGTPHIMISHRCVRLITALRECELKISGKFGTPYPAHPYSHLTDTVGYLAWWAWPKPKRPDRPIGIMYESVPMPKRI